MSYQFLPSAEHAASVRIVLALYYNKDIEQMLEKEIELPFYRSDIFDRERYELWKQIEMTVIEKLHFLPSKMKIRLSKCIRPIHIEAWQWVRNHEGLLKRSASYCYLTYKNTLCWKTDGTVDKVKTAKRLVRDASVDTKTRFAVACTYFLEEEVLALWHKNKEINEMSIPREGTNKAVRFWIKILKRGLWGKKFLKAMINRYFKMPSKRRSDIPLRISCFFPYLSWEGKKNYFFPLLECNTHDDDLFLCMKTMDETERIELLKEHPANILYSYLKWPLQSLFMEKANELLIYMDFTHCYALLVNIIDWYILKGIEHFNYLEVLKEFWNIIPESLKDEIKSVKNTFKYIELALNYEKENASQSLLETLDAFEWGLWS